MTQQFLLHWGELDIAASTPIHSMPLRKSFIEEKRAEHKKKELTPEQEKDKKALVEKYDTNKDGKLDKEERAKMSKEDKQKWSDIMGGKKDEKKDDKK